MTPQECLLGLARVDRPRAPHRRGAGVYGATRKRLGSGGPACVALEARRGLAGPRPQSGTTGHARCRLRAPDGGAPDRGAAAGTAAARRDALKSWRGPGRVTGGCFSQSPGRCALARVAWKTRVKFRPGCLEYRDARRGPAAPEREDPHQRLCSPSKTRNASTPSRRSSASASRGSSSTRSIAAIRRTTPRRIVNAPTNRSRA